MGRAPIFMLVALVLSQMLIVLAYALGDSPSTATAIPIVCPNTQFEDAIPVDARYASSGASCGPTGGGFYYALGPFTGPGRLTATTSAPNECTPFVGRTDTVLSLYVGQSDSLTCADSSDDTSNSACSFLERKVTADDVAIGRQFFVRLGLFGEGSRTFGEGVGLTITFECDNLAPVCPSIGISNKFVPPSGKLETFTVSATDTVDDTVAIRITKVTQTEPSKQAEGGKKTACAQAVYDSSGKFASSPLSFQLVADRLGSGSGRLYFVDYEATDSFDVSCKGTVNVCIPKSSSPSEMQCVDNGVRINSVTC